MALKAADPPPGCARGAEASAESARRTWWTYSCWCCQKQAFHFGCWGKKKGSGRGTFQMSWGRHSEPFQTAVAFRQRDKKTDLKKTPQWVKSCQFTSTGRISEVPLSDKPCKASAQSWPGRLYPYMVYHLYVTATETWPPGESPNHAESKSCTFPWRHRSAPAPRPTCRHSAPLPLQPVMAFGSAPPSAPPSASCLLMPLARPPARLPGGGPLKQRATKAGPLNAEDRRPPPFAALTLLDLCLMRCCRVFTQ